MCVALTVYESVCVCGCVCGCKCAHVSFPPELYFFVCIPALAFRNFMSVFAVPRPGGSVFYAKLCSIWITDIIQGSVSDRVASEKRCSGKKMRPMHYLGWQRIPPNRGLDNQSDAHKGMQTHLRIEVVKWKDCSQKQTNNDSLRVWMGFTNVLEKSIILEVHPNLHKIFESPPLKWHRKQLCGALPACPVNCSVSEDENGWLSRTKYAYLHTIPTHAF